MCIMLLDIGIFNFNEDSKVLCDFYCVYCWVYIQVGRIFVLTNTFLSKVYFALDYSDFFEIDDFSVTLPEEKVILKN